MIYRDSQQLLCIANITKLFKSKVHSVKDYKKACKGLKPENIPFADLYANILAVEPERTDEWNAWGKRDCRVSDRSRIYTMV